MGQPTPTRRQLIVRWAVFLAILGLLWIARRQDSPPADRAEPAAQVARTPPPPVEPRWTPPPRGETPADEAEPSVEVATRPVEESARRSGKASPARSERTPRRGGASGDGLVIEGLSLRDSEGRTIYRGSIDLAPTLERIAAGKRLRFPNDGSTFQNRERRLPGRAAGYYREWVVPTPGEPGPGPQRLVTGEEGEVWYTPDHYRSFRRVPTEALSR